MKIPLYVAVAQWALLAGLGTLVIIMYRYLGRALGRKVPEKLGPPVGSRAENFEFLRLSDKTWRHVTPGGGQPMLVAFVEPSCLPCEQLVTVLGTAWESGELSGLQVMLLISEPLRYLDLSGAFRETPLEIGQVSAHATLHAYGVSATPLLVAIDREGIVKSAGPARDITEVQAASHACLMSAPASETAVHTGTPRAH